MWLIYKQTGIQHNIFFSAFGCPRRLSYNWHALLLEEPQNQETKIYSHMPLVFGEEIVVHTNHLPVLDPVQYSRNITVLFN